MSCLPDPHANWWCYTNHHVQNVAKDYCKDRFELSVEMKNTCSQRDAHVAIPTKQEDFDQPIVLTCYQPGHAVDAYGEKQCFLSVYGIRKTVYFMFKDSTPSENLHYVPERRKLLHFLQDMDLKFVRDLKLVYKRPYKSACVGPKLFLKLYLTGMYSVNKLRTTFKQLRVNGMDSLDNDTIHDVSLGQETRWFNCKRAHTVGRLKTTRPIFVRDKENYYEAAVHHEDIVFDIMENLDCPFRPKTDVEIMEMIFTGVVNPVADALATGPTKSVIKHDLSFARKSFMQMLSGDQEWSWRKLKQAIVIKPFEWVLRSRTDLRVESHVKQFGGYNDDEFAIVDGWRLEPAIKHVFYQVLKIAYEIKAGLKQFWKEHVLQPASDERKTYTNRLTREISDRKRWLAFDIETDHRPHEQKEETIILVSSVLFDHLSSDATEYVVFFRMPSAVSDSEYATGVSENDVVQLVRSQFTDQEFKNMAAGTTFHIRLSRFEHELLQQFREYVHKTKCSFVAYFNGNRFDLPFIANRHAMHFYTATEAQKQKLRCSNVIGRSIKYSFSYKHDEGIVRYVPPSARHVHKSYGINVHAEKIMRERERHKDQRKIQREKRRYNQIYGHEENLDIHESLSSSSDDDDDHDKNLIVEEEVSLRADTRKYQGFLLPARKIQSILMNNVAVVDVMQFVGKPNRGCKLNTAAHELLGFHKYEDECVSYDNMCDTWLRGDRIKLAAYSIIDTLLLERIVKVKKLNGFHLTLGEIIGLSERELYLNESIRRLISNAHRIGYTENLLTPDTGLVRNDNYMWVPEFEFQSERDYKNLRPPAGSTVPDVFGIYYTPCATLDFKAQYPSIMAGYNYCLTSLVDKWDINALNLVEGKDYTSLRLENVKPVVSHACERRGKKCNGGVDGKSDPRRCQYDLNYEIVYYTAYFATETMYKSVLNRSARAMSTARNTYKQLRDQAEEKGDVVESAVYDLSQFAVKTVDNSTYGATMRFNGIVGDAITHMGRYQARCLAKLAAEKGMAVVNGDTDSVFIQLIPEQKDCDDFGAMARYYDLNPRDVTVTDIVNRWFQDSRAFVDEANNGNASKQTRPLYPKPCTLELEKVFVSIRNLAKKCYMGDKIVPGKLEVSVHKSGLTGKKADTTKIKSASQFVCDKLIVRKDFDGLMEFIRNLHDLVSWEIRHQDKTAAEISELCKQIDDGNLNCPVAKTVRKTIQRLYDEEEQRQKEMRYLVPLQWLISKERVGDVDDPKTVATKRAIELCKFRGEDRHNAPLFIDVCRTSAVQVAAGILKILNIFLSAPMSEKYEESRNKRFRACHDEKTWKKRQHLQKTARTREETKRSTVTKLDVTAMPAKWRVQPTAKYQPTDKQRESAEMLTDYINAREKMYQRERESGYSGVAASQPTVLQNVGVEAVKTRLLVYVDKYTECDPFPPLFMFSPDMAASSVQHLTPELQLLKRESACDIWTLYLADLLDKRLRFVKVCWSGERVGFAFSETSFTKNADEILQHFGPDDCSWDPEQVHCLDTCAKSFVLDMNAYREQTQSTPYVIPTYNGKHVYLANRDSYKVNKKDAFAFEVSAKLFLEKLIELQKASTISIQNVVQTRNILMIGKGRKEELNVERILRADGRPMPLWRWGEEPYSVITDRLREAVDKLVVDAAVPAKKISVVLDRETMMLTVSDEVSFNNIYIDLTTSYISQKRLCEEPTEEHIHPKKKKKKCAAEPSDTLPIHCYFSRVDKMC